MRSPFIKVSSGNLAAMNQQKTGYLIGLMAAVNQEIWNKGISGATGEELYSALLPMGIALKSFANLMEAMRQAGAVYQKPDGNWFLTEVGEKFLPRSY